MCVYTAVNRTVTASLQVWSAERRRRSLASSSQSVRPSVRLSGRFAPRFRSRQLDEVPHLAAMFVIT